MRLQRLNPGPRMSQAVLIGDTAFLAGQVPTDLTGDIAAQTREVLDKVDAVMAELGGTKADIASVQVWLADMADFQGMNAVWDAWVDAANPPARATCGVALARPGMRVEMIVVARAPR
ncbi:RidA family protein [Roseivivax isoporae]|uniref:Endoribonuclease n=1 Tax=Roseivivax isoporae LMG 25204 TaxID=1449351 RepID=X7F8S0_9RHOB|nr:RidA family protein [Roseivivax isoporae]ETX29205.1 endoribonuclease [Roseivivax isoporae LMG 25204]